MMKSHLKFLLPVILLLITAQPALAHASLARSSPPANASVETTPTEIRLWFTEPLEADYSRIVLYDSSGKVVPAPPSEVSGADAYQMFLRPGELSQGVYTVSWRALSAADGHPSEGSFAFGVGTSVTAAPVVPQLDETIPVESALVRWFNLLSLSLLVGTVGFCLFVWYPVQGNVAPVVYRLAWGGWLLTGVSGVLMLVLQITSAAGLPFLAGITQVDYGAFLMGTAYGKWWLMRTSLWFFIGTALDMRQRPRLALWLVLFLSGALLLTHSLYSHASAAEDTAAAVAGGWLHLLGSSLWIGGLIAFAVILWQARQEVNSTGALVAYFSNYARTGVIALILTGFYAAWLHVGSPEALLTTVYGRTLLVKLILFLPLLALAGVNLIFTARGLRRGESIWVGRLRALVGAEVALTLGVLVAAAVLISGVPARDVMMNRAAMPVLPETEPYSEIAEVDDLSFHLEITPGFAGENTFTIMPFDAEGNPIEDVSRIRLRFDNLSQPMGQSELRPEAQGSGVYSASGANLSAEGRWRVRMTVSRPGAFDQVMDYVVDVPAPPTPILPAIDDDLPVDQRWIAAAFTGIGLVVVGGLTWLTQKPRLILRASLAAALIVIGVIFTFSAAVPFSLANVSPLVQEAWALPGGEGMTLAVYMRIENPGIVADRVVGAETEIAERVEFHENMVIGDSGHMMWQSGLDVPAAGALELSPGGFHVMLIDLKRDLNEGETFPLTLRFESGKIVETVVQVQTR